MLKARLTLPYRVNLSLYLTSGCHWTDNGAPSVNGRAQMFNLLANITQYSEIKSQVEAKWDIIAMLCLLLFFLTMVVLVFYMAALLRRSESDRLADRFLTRLRGVVLRCPKRIVT